MNGIKVGIEIKTGFRFITAVLERAIDCLRFNRASAKANSEYCILRSCRSQFVVFSLFLAMFYFPSDISVFFIL